jgi:hypothetical protein
MKATAPSINQVGFMTPPSSGAAPTWDAIVEVGGSQQFVSEGRYYECHSLKAGGLPCQMLPATPPTTD